MPQEKQSDKKRPGTWQTAIMQAAVFVLPSLALAQQLPVAAPVNPEFVQHRIAPASAFRAAPGELPGTAALLPGAGGTGATGLHPSPLDRTHMTGLAPAAHGVHRFGTMAVTGTFPATFDLRSLGFLSPVRNQGACGSCWAFASIGSAESNALVSGAGTFDFSENHLNVRHGFAVPACQGGNADMSAAYQTRWGNTDGLAAGLVNESDDPYTGGAATSIAGLSPRNHVQEVLALPRRANATDNANYKFAIQTYGALDVSIYADNGMASSSNSTAWNQTTKALNYTGTSYPNHEVALVGWDDNYAATNFATRPAGNGAFIVRNSWGAAWGESGYFHISYYDAALTGGHVFRTPDSATNYVRAYLYDPFGQTTSYGYSSNTAYGANVFTAAASESLTAVAINTSTVDTAYEISIYTGVTSTPATGVLEGGAVNTTGTSPYAGYHTIKLSRPVSLIANQKFAVVVKFTTPGYNYPIPLEAPFSGYENATASAGQSFMSANGSTWTDVVTTNPNSNVDIRAFTSLPAAGTTLASSANPSTVGQAVVFTATITAAGSTPTGTVTFTDGTATLCNAVSVVASSGKGTAVCSSNVLTTGVHTITAKYTGSTAVTSGTATLTQTVNAAAPAATTATLTSSLSPSNVGQNVTFTATVASTSGTPGGIVVFKDGTATLCSASLAAVAGKGQATCATAALVAGTHSIVASYAATANYGASSASTTQTVNAVKVASTTAVTAGVNPATVGQSVTFTAVVGGSAGTPVGTVSFVDGTTSLCSAVPLALVGGKAQAVCTTSALKAGSHTVMASFAGSTAYNASSGSVLVTVNAPKAASTTSVVASANPTVGGKSVTLTATVSGAAGNASGTVTFLDGTATLCGPTTLSPVAGKMQAVCTTSTLAAGTHTIAANFGGNAAYNASAGSIALTVTAPKAASATALAYGYMTSKTSQQLTINGVVTGPGVRPTGTVTMKDGATTLCTATLAVVNGLNQAYCSVTTIPVGTHLLTANYNGDGNYLPSVSMGYGLVTKALK